MGYLFGKSYLINHDRGTWLHWLRTIKVKGLINENPAIKKDEIISGRVSDTSKWK